MEAGVASFNVQPVTKVGERPCRQFSLKVETEPEVIHFGEVFEKSDKPMLRFWITRDERRLPVRIQSKVIVGSIIGDLVSIR
ncbi:MAG: DUF3108 domain-containing protein [Desulfobacter postgatei]|nr:DUF3108 domain-containing protein [Desulfobacter postgatei]